MIQRSLVAILMMSLSTGCTTYYKGSPQIELGAIGYEPLTSAEYEISGDAEGHASGGRFLFFSYGAAAQRGILDPSSFSTFTRRSGWWFLLGWIGAIYRGVSPLSFNSSPGAYVEYSNARSWSKLYRSAVYDALENTPTADAVLLPRFTLERTTYIPLLWNSWRADVIGKTIRITKDTY